MSYVPERPTKNENQYTKILLFALSGEDGWEEDLGAWRHKARPVYRKPQAEWEASTTHDERYVYFLPDTVVGSPEPDSVTFPDWLCCRWDSQAGRWVIIATDGSGSVAYGDFVEFYELVAGECSITQTPPTAALINVTNPFCGQSAMEGEEVVVYDPLGCIFDLDEEELVDVMIVFGRGTIPNPFFDDDPGTEEAPNACYSPQPFICVYTAIDRCCTDADGMGSGSSSSGSDFESF